MGNSHNGGIYSGCSDVALVLVEIIDKDGVVVPTASNVVTFSHSGSSLTFLGGGNGDPASHTNNKASTREAFGGKLLGFLAQPIHQGRRQFSFRHLVSKAQE